MGGDKFDQLYNALKADGAVSGTRENFKKFVYAPGAQGYKNRLQLYNALHADGAVSSKSYEEFTQKLGLHAVNRTARQTVQAQPQSKAAQQAVAYKAPQVPEGWGDLDTSNVQTPWMKQHYPKPGTEEVVPAHGAKRPKKKPATNINMANWTPVDTGEKITGQKAVKPVYREKKEGKYWNPITETDMGNNAVLDWSTTDENGDKVANVDKKQDFEADATAKALAQALADDANYKGKWAKFDEEFSKHHGLIYHPAEYTENKNYKEEGFDDNSYYMYKKYAPKMEDISNLLGGRSSGIIAAASKLGMTPEGFLKQYLAPAFEKKNEEEFRKRGIEHFMPKNAWENMKANFAVSSAGSAANESLVPEEYQNMRNEAVEEYSERNKKIMDEKGVFSAEGLAALGSNFAGGSARVAPDVVGFYLGGGEAKLTMKALSGGWSLLRGSGIVTKILGKAAPTLARLTEKYGTETAAKMVQAASNSSASAFLRAGTRQFGHGALTMGFFEGNNYLMTEGREKLKEGKVGEAAKGFYTHGMSGLGTGILFGGIGMGTGFFGRGLGITGKELTKAEVLKHGAEKAAYSAAALFAEGLGFKAEELYDEAKRGELTFGSVLENGGKGIIDKITMDIGMGAGKGKLPNLKRMLVGATHNTTGGVKFSATEKNEILNSTGGKSLLEGLDEVGRQGKMPPMYKGATAFFSDPNVSRRTKQKVAYVLGKTIDTNIPRTERVSITQGEKGTQVVRTYSKDGELLSVDAYANKEKAEMAKQEVYMKRDRDDFLALWNDSIQPTQKENNAMFEEVANRMGESDLGVFLAKLEDAESNGDADFLSKYEKIRNEVVGKVLGDKDKARLDIMRDVNAEYKVDIDKVLDKDPTLWKDNERDAVNELGNRLKNGFADKNDEESNRAVAHQDGADLSEQTELEDSEKFTENAKTVNDRQASATAAWMEMVKNTPELEEWMKNNPDATVEEMRDNFGDDVADAYMELSKAKSMRDGFVQNTAQKIEDAVQNQVAQARFTGTIDGEKSDLIYLYTDKDGNEYTLIGGDIVWDGNTNHYKVGDNSLAIFRDKDGNIVQKTELGDLKPTDRLSAEDYANRVRTTLQEQKTAEIQSTETPLPESPKEEPKNEGGETPTGKEGEPKGGESSSHEEESPYKVGDEVELKETDLQGNDTGKTKKYKIEGRNEHEPEMWDIVDENGKKTSVDDEYIRAHIVKKGGLSDSVDGGRKVKNPIEVDKGKIIKPQDESENSKPLTFKDGTEVPMNEKGEPDFSKMTPEQGAELYEENFDADAESTLASERKAAEKALKDANKMKISGSGWSEKVKAKKEREAAIAAAQAEIDRVDAIQKALAAKKVEETLTASKPESADGAEANVAGSVAAEKFQKAPKVVGRKGSRTLADGTKIKGTYMIVPAESLTASHDATNGYKKSEGFPVNAEGRTINDRDYEHDKDAQDVTEQMGAKYDGQAVNQVPTVSDEGIVYDGNGRTMAGQLAAKKGTDTEYVEALKENAEAFGLTAEDVDKIEHPRVIFVPDERLPYNTETFARFNRNEKKSQSNTQEAIANSKKLSPKDVGAIIGEIENSGSLDSFFNNPKAINDLLKTLVEKGIIGQNEVAGLMDGDLMSAKGREFVQNLLLGAVFKEDTLKMMGIEKGLKSKALNAMRQIMDNSKLGEYSLREEIDKAVQLLYEAKRKGYTVDGLLRQPEMFGESASERYPIEVQIMAKALEGKVADFKEIMEAYNKNAQAFNTGEADMFGEKPTKEEFINEILKLESWKKYDTRKEKQADQSAVDDGGTEGSEPKTRGDNEEGAGGIGKEEFDEGIKEIATEITKQTGIEVVTDEKTGQEVIDNAEADGTTLKYSKREKPAPKKTQKVYKLMRLGDDGKLYPLFIDATAPTELGVWYDADSPDLSMLKDLPSGVHLVNPKTKKTMTYEQFYNEHPELFKGKMSKYPSKEAIKWATQNGMRFMYIEDTKKAQKRFEGEHRKYWNLGVNGSGTVSTFSMRPGWHAGSLPTMRQIGKGENKDLRDDRFVWVEGEVSADKDYSSEVESNPDHDLPDRIPEDGYYMKATNADKTKSQADRVGWYVAGSFKANRIIGDKEAHKVIDDWNVAHPDKKVEYDYERESGKEFNADTMQLEGEGKDRKEFRTKDGEVYGFVKDGKIYLDVKKMRPETPLHEYTHLWTEALKSKNPKEWENVKKLFDEVEGLKEEVQKLYPELKGDDLYDEMIATYSGREGTKKLEDVVWKLSESEYAPETEADERGIFSKIKTALQKYWKGVADMLHIHFTNAEEVADKVLADWAKGVKPGEITNSFEKFKEDSPESIPEGVSRKDVLGFARRRKFWGKTEDYNTYNAKRTTVEIQADKLYGTEKKWFSPKNGGGAIAMHDDENGCSYEIIPHKDAQGHLKSVTLVKYHDFDREEGGGTSSIDENKPWKEMTPVERAVKADAEPMSEEEIRNGASEENQELVAAAVAYVNGDKSLLNQIAYLKIYGDVRNRHENVPGNSGTEDGTQLAATDNGSGDGLELESGRGSRGAVEPVDKGAGGETAPGEPESGENGKGGTNPPAGKQGDSQGEGGTPGLGGLSAGGAGPEGSGATGGTGDLGGRGRRGGSSRPPKSNAKRKPSAKQGTIFPDSKGADVKKETSDAKAAMKAAFAEFKKRGKKGSVSISLVGMNNEQIEYLPELMKATGKYGIAVMREGIYKAKEWFDNIREAISDDMKDVGFSDADVDEYIREMWHMPWTMDDETHKISEWSSIYGYAKFRDELKKPLRKKFDAQVLAEPTEVKVGDKKNIEETLPFLLPQQQEDVLRAETQFFDKSHKDKAHAGGKGYMFTNGTGTGKTYTGLGIVKRMMKQGKKRILIITPSQAKVNDWKNDGKNLCLDIRDLDEWAKERGTTATTEKGEGVVITTFANFRANKALLEDQFDMVVYDESHRIMENKKGIDTEGSRQHYKLTNRNEGYALMRLEETNEDWQKMKALAEDFDKAREKKISEIEEQYRKENPNATDREVRNAVQKLNPKDINSFSIAEKQKFPELGKIYDDYISAKSYYEKSVKPGLVEQAKKAVDATKVVFLSATPFNSRENIEYAEGYLFSYPERNAMGQSGKTQFFLEHFGAGYKYRYHRLENSVSNAEALSKQEVDFSDWLQNDLGTMSGRVIDSPYDYSRDFPTVAVEQAQAFNEACEEISRDKLGAVLYQNVLGDYNYGNALFETMKVGALLPRLKAHLDAGRKVVVFHRRVASKQPLKPPFELMLGEVANRVIKAMPENERAEATKKVQEWRQKYADLLAWEQTLDYSMPREQLAKAFGKDNVLFFSGNESSKEKNAAIAQFNSDDSGKNIIVIQEASGKEGISLHDTTGKHQRVCITLALPQSPITALQIEGRTYRIGNESNAIFEYPVLGLSSEYNLFASKFNQQVSTTENLALGSQARNLRESFARGIEEHSGYVPIDQQGVGGKDFDRGEVEDRDQFDNAVLDYYTNQKINRNNREGADYFPTPEPLGYKMVEWANIGEEDSVLEPSAGHGAIARYVPKSNELVAIEPSMSLFAKLQMKAGGTGRKFQNGTFEDYFVGNKHDTIVMNPPFGHAGTTAIEHLAKAFGHLEEGGRIVAIIPRGATDKKFDKWLGTVSKAVLRAEVNLPDIAFQQAGTKVNCRVVVLDRISDPALREKAGYPEKVDLSGHYDKIEDFFNDLRDVEMPDRIIDTNFKMQKLSKSLARNLKDVKGVKSVDINKTEVYVKVARDWRGYGISFSGSDNPQRWREKMGDAYDKYSQMEKTELNGDKQAVFGELKELACKLAGMTEDEMRRYLTSKNSNSYDDGGVRFRMELGKTFSNSKEDFDGVRDRAVEEKGIVMPNLNKESVKVVSVEKHRFGETEKDIISNAKSWAKENLVTTDKTELPTMHDGTTYTISKAAIDKYLSESAVKKSESLDTHISVLPKLKEVIRESIEAEIHPDYIKAEDGNRSVENGYGNNVLVHRLYGAVQLDGRTYRVKTTMQEFRGGEENKPHSYEVTKIELLDSPGERENPDRPHSDAPNNSISVAKLLNGVEKSYDKGKKLLDESKDLADGETRFRKGDDVETSTNEELTPREKEQQEQMEGHKATVLKATEKLNTRTTIHDSVEDIENETVRKAIENGEKVKAWYDTKTGEVHLYLPNVTDKYDAQKSIVHEVVGHKGMRNLLGESGYRDMMRRMYTHLSEEEAAEVNERMMKNGWDFYTAMDEWVADKAEESVWTPQEYPKYIGLSNLWSHIKHYVTEAIHKAGYNINPNVDDVKYWLWESKKALQNGDAYTEMKRNSFLWKLNRSAAKMTLSDIINDPAYNTNIQEGTRFRKVSDDDADIQEAKVLFRKGSLDYGKNDIPQETATKDAIERRLGSWKYRETEAWKDSMSSLDVTEREMKKGVKNFDSSMDVYHGVINQSSVVAEKRANFERRELKDLQNALKKPTKALGGGERGYENVNVYVYMKSGLERNRVLLVRDITNDIDKQIKKFNAELKEKDPKANVITYKGIEQYRDEFHAEKDYLTTLLEQGQIDLQQYYGKLDKFIRDFEFKETGDKEVDAKIKKLNKWYKDNVADEYDPNKNDYSGISSIAQYRVNGQFSDSAIIDAVMQAENTIGIDNVENLWSAIGGVTGFALESDHNYGIVSSAARDRAKGMFNWYIPMRGFKEDSMEDSYAYMRSDSSKLASSSLKTAKGRTTLAQSPLGTAAAMAERAISRGEDNANKQRMYRLASAWLKEHTEIDANGEARLTEVPPVMVSDVWYEKKTDSLGNDYWEVVTPDIKPDMNAGEIRKAIADFETDMKAKQAKGGATKTLQKGVYAKPFEDPMHKKQNVVTVWFGGKQRQIIFTGNPRAAQALNGELKSDAHQNALMHFMGSMFTSYNVTFSMSNLSRDTLFANNNISIRENAEYYARFTAMQVRLGLAQLWGTTMLNTPKVRGEYFNMWAHYKQGKAPKGDLEKLFYEFMDNGGKTGFVKTRTIDDFENEIRKNAGGRKAVETVGKALHALPEVIEGLNERAENMNRFACYATSRKMGRSIMRSISDAKEVSTNFNRRGLGGAAFDVPGTTKFEKYFVKHLSNWCQKNYLFFNAGMQSLRILQKNLHDHAIKTTINTIGIPLVLGGYIIPLLNQVFAGDDGEKYASLPEWDRRNNFCFYLGKNKWLKIPLPIELRGFYGLGDVARSVEDKRLQSANGVTLDAIAQLTQIFPIDFMGEGMNPAMAVVPDVAKPAVQSIANMDWTGKPLYKDYDYMKYDPEYTKVYAGEFEPFVNLSKFINEESGGTAVTKGSLDGWWNNPAIWNNIMQGYFGGAGSDATRAVKLGKRLITGDWDDFSTRELPMVRAMYSTPTEKTVYYRGLSKYAKYKEISDQYDHDMRVWKKNKDNPEISIKYNAELHGNSLKKRINALIEENEKVFKAARKIINSGELSDADAKSLQMQIDKAKLDLVNEIDNMK